MTSILAGPTAMLAINSLDRYTIPVGTIVWDPATQSFVLGKPGLASQDNILLALYNNSYINAQAHGGFPQPGVQPTCASFSLNNAGPLIYGYIKTIAISQVQMNYKIPTVVPSNRIFPAIANLSYEPERKGNDTLLIVCPNNILTQIYQSITIPYGFYTPAELAAVLQTELSALPGLSTMKVTYTNANQVPPAGSGANPGEGNSFIFQTTVSSNQIFYFPNDYEMGLFTNGGRYNFIPPQITVALKTYLLLGLNIENSQPTIGLPGYNYIQTQSPNFLYTSYIDITSNALTKFQKIKDTDTATLKRSSIISRVYLSGVGNPQSTSSEYGLGCQPFFLTADLNTPKVVRWSPDETVFNLDFSLYDQYGDPIYWDGRYPTEFQMTLLCAEGE